METNNVTESLRKVFMAGVGAVAAVGEKGGDLMDSLAERGESAVRQGKDLNRELAQKGAAAVGGIREDVLRGILSVMSPADRAQFVADAERLVAELDARDAARAAQDGAEPAAAVTVPVTAGDAPVEASAPAGEPGSCAADAPAADRG